MEKFPSLVDADGWQVVSQQQFDRDSNENLGSAWRDRAKAAIPLPAPVVTPRLIVVRNAAAVKQNGAIIDQKQRELEAKVNADFTETDYDFRHRRGKHRAWNRRQFSRG